MSNFITLSSVMALVMSTPLLQAQVPTLRALPFGIVPAQSQGNCDLMASNTVRATFVGIRTLAVQRVDQPEPSQVQVGVFQVIDNLAYRRFNRIGDNQLTPGMQFTIAMNKQLPGQPAENVDTIAALQPGEEVVMRVDHLYLITGQEGESIRVCARLGRRNPGVPDSGNTAAAAAPQTPAPLPIPDARRNGYGPAHVQMSSSSFSFSSASNGQVQTVQTSRVYDPNTGEIKTRMLINGVEVDPVTRQPLSQAPVAQPGPQITPAPTPVNEQQAQQEAAEDENDDTIIEHNNNPVVEPGDDPVLTPEITPPAEPAPVTPAEHLDSADNF